MRSIYRKLIHTHCSACQMGTSSCLQLHEGPTSSFHLKDNTPDRSMCKFMSVLTPVKVSYLQNQYHAHIVLRFFSFINS